MIISRRKLIAAGGLLAGVPYLSWGVTSAQPFRFVQLCDPQLGMGGYEADKKRFAAAVEKINSLKPDFVAVCGDLVQDANDASFADYVMIRDKLDVPYYEVSGNHDVGNKPTHKSLASYRDVIGDDWYAFEHKGHAFVVVNTQLWKSPLEGESERQDIWLRETLQSFNRKKMPVWVLAHYPLFLKAPDEADEYMNLPEAKRKELLSLFKKHGVVAVLGGHVHRYLENEYQGMQLVNGETTSKNFDKRPFGFRVWSVEGRSPYRQEFISIDITDDG